MTEETMAGNFIHDIIDDDLAAERLAKGVHTRFPPEPNGYLHIGHAKSICLNFGTAKKYKGLCNLRFDDTNPSREEVEFTNSIMEDVHWLGFDWQNRMYFASDYFQAIYECAVTLIESGKAYICELNADQMREHRGNTTVAGTSPYRDRPIAESLQIFTDMKDGKYPDGAYTLRAKIDLASPNFVMRDPVLYRIQRGEHHRTGNDWCIYPMYDFAHPISDAIEGITHSICTLEFENHRPLYDWVLDNLNFKARPHQIEFARLNITHTVMSKRKLRRLVEEGYVNGWDDPRMPTISGLRRRGYTPESIKDFCERIGVAKSNSTVDLSFLEHCIREDLNQRADRVMAVLDPLKVVITNYPEDKSEWLILENNPEDEGRGKRQVAFGRELYIEASDFMEDAPKKYFRLRPDGEVRLKGAYIIKCEEVIKDENGKVVELHCTYEPDTKSGSDNSGKKVKGTIHWVNAKKAMPIKVNLYDHLFTQENPEDVPEGTDFVELINPASLQIIENALIEPMMPMVGEKFQFMRNGYFVVDQDTMPGEIIFNRIVSLKDSYKKN